LWCLWLFFGGDKLNYLAGPKEMDAWMRIRDREMDGLFS
jgi:hypothetical protein